MRRRIQIVFQNPHSALNGRHTIFGQVTEGYDVVEAISSAPTRGADRPVPLPVAAGPLLVLDDVTLEVEDGDAPTV